jgi:hypothetical protein
VASVSDAVFFYFAHQSGRLMPAPDTRMRPEQCGLDPKQWRRCEAKGPREIEKVSLILSRQAFEEWKDRKVGQILREMDFLKQRAASARLRRAVNFSVKDVQMNERLELRWNWKHNQMLKLIAQEFDPQKRNTALEVELREAPINPHHLGQKKVGVSA